MTSPTASPTLDQARGALIASAGRLAALVTPLTPEQRRGPSYCDGWSVADVLSHLGSGGVIIRKRLEGDQDLDPQPIWDAWNAKSPEDQAADALLADGALLKAVATLGADDEAGLRFPMGPTELTLTSFLGLRLNEHLLHTWDIAVMLDPTATIPAEAAGLALHTVGVIVGFAGRYDGAARTLTVRTSAPTLDLAIALGAEGVGLSAGEGEGDADLVLPAEALIRLIYGRLDAAHTPAVGGRDPAVLDELRGIFPGL